MSLKRLASTAALLAAGVLSASSAFAVTTWTFSYTGAGVTASGSFTTAGNAAIAEDILSITGTRNGVAISGLVPLGVDPDFSYDNQFARTTPNFTIEGLLFRAGTQNYNLYYDGGVYYDLYVIGGITPVETPITWVVSTVPEPAAVLSMLAGLGLMGAFMRRGRHQG
jgi:hypothetical protein